jgi:hypothetical protein
MARRLSEVSAGLVVAVRAPVEPEENRLSVAPKLIAEVILGAVVRMLAAAVRAMRHERWLTWRWRIIHGGIVNRGSDMPWPPVSHERATKVFVQSEREKGSPRRSRLKTLSRRSERLLSVPSTQKGYWPDPPGG